MKINLFLLFLSITTAYSQLGLDFPKDLMFDPYDYKISDLGFKEVIQYRTWVIPASDSTTNNRVLFSMDYVVNYDSLNNLTNFKFDFASIYSWQYLSGINSHLYSPSPIEDSSAYFFFEHEDSTYSLFFQNYAFQYDKRQLVGVETIPSKKKYNPIAGVLDGIYYPSNKVIKETIEYIYDEENKLIEKRITNQNDKTETWRYFYKTFEAQYGEYVLIERIEVVNNGEKMIYHIQYLN